MEGHDVLQLAVAPELCGPCDVAQRSRAKGSNTSLNNQGQKDLSNPKMLFNNLKSQRRPLANSKTNSRQLSIKESDKSKR